MNIAHAWQILSRKEPPELYDLVGPALKDTALRDAIVEGSFEKNETVRYNCSRVLFRAINHEPRLFYSYWDHFAKMIRSQNGFHRAVAAQAIASLVPVDTDCRLDPLLGRYLRLLDDPSVMVSHYFIETLDGIYRARPDLQKRILTTLLSIDRTSHPLPRKELLKADILMVLDRLFEGLSAQERKRSVAFAEAAIESDSGKTRKAAKSFLATHSG